jgi:hypothetical protein
MRTSTRFALSISLAGALLVGCGGSQPMTGALGAMNESRDSLPYHKTFRYTGAEQSFNVPAGVTQLTIVALGTRGAGARSGAHGGRVYAVIPVTPGEQLAVFVGAEGSGTSGGFNGGGSAGGSAYDCYCPGYGGGGASDIRQGGDKLGDRVLVVGGGGGEGGKGNDYSTHGGAGGKAGGAFGDAGQAGQRGVGGDGGAGGTQQHGGFGGAGAPGGSFSCAGASGDTGSRVQCGDGGAGCDAAYYDYGGGGGGGGGGYHGGGGGGGGSGCFYCGTPGGGGGGGSSYVEPSAIKFRTWSGWNSAKGNGLVVFSWQ